jgi:hypothetical protein
MATTARTLVTGAFEELGLVRPGETVEAEDAAFGLSRLNDMLDAWRTDPAFAFGEFFSVATLTPGTQSLTIGTGQAFDVPRPCYIGPGSFVRLTGQDEPLTVITAQQYGSIDEKDQQTSWPAFVWLDGDWPVARVSFWPVASATVTVHLNLHEWVAPFGSLNASQDLAPGYAKAIRLSLAEDIAHTYNRDPARIERRASVARKAIQRPNVRVPDLMPNDGWRTRLGDFVGGR